MRLRQHLRSLRLMHGMRHIFTVRDVDFPTKTPGSHWCHYQASPGKGEVEKKHRYAAEPRGLCQHHAALPASWVQAPTHYYDGKQIVSLIHWIIFRRNSAPVLGKLLVGDILKNHIPPQLKEKFLTQFNLTPADMIDCVYAALPQPEPPFLAQNLDEPIRTWYRTASRHSSNVRTLPNTFRGFCITRPYWPKLPANEVSG